MRYASLALRRDMLRVGCNSSGISSISAIEWQVDVSGKGLLLWRLRGVDCLLLVYVL